MEAAFKVGANYIDLAGSRQLQFNEKWRDADLTASIGAGEDPPIEKPKLPSYSYFKIISLNLVKRYRARLHKI